MKRVILSVFIIVVLVWSCDEAFCRGGARGGGGRRGPAVRQRQIPIRQSREQDRIREREREQERLRDGSGEGKGYQQQMMVFEKQMRQEEVKHRWRVARLKQIRRLAAGAGRAEITKRVDGLLIMERDRYERRLGRISQEMERALQAAEESGD